MFYVGFQLTPIMPASVCIKFYQSSTSMSKQRVKMILPRSWTIASNSHYTLAKLKTAQRYS